MSIVCEELKESPYKQLGISGYVRATIDPTTANQLPLPSDYKYFSCVLPKNYANWAKRIQDFKVRPDDIWILGLQKTGTTWMLNIVHQLKIKTLDFTAEYVQPNYLERPAMFENIDNAEEMVKYAEIREKALDDLGTAPSPRIIKSHLPAYLLPKELWSVQSKIIYTSRDAKDVAVSSYHMYRNLSFQYEGTMTEFFDCTLNEFTLFGPFYDHISSFNQLRDLEHILLTSYEELTKNTFECVKRVSQFLECSYSNEQLQQLVQHVSFGKMREKITVITNQSADRDFRFCRKGKIGGYKDDMSAEYEKRFDDWTAKKKQELNLL